MCVLLYPECTFDFGFESVLLSIVNDSVMRKQLLSLLFFTLIIRIHTLLYPETVNSLFHVHVEFIRSLITIFNNDCLIVLCNSQN